MNKKNFFPLLCSTIFLLGCSWGKSKPISDHPQFIWEQLLPCLYIIISFILIAVIYLFVNKMQKMKKEIEILKNEINKIKHQ